ncbi:ATP-dependent helicase [archaeon]|nr:ATP-dependent helicase [archaeon]MBT3438985.1 ATP-dependent helicase [Candidatus Woesearchaeota archaeon]MBT4208316.1 ATP-dependent helicase [Candidatus Woesearchaeota archaeon]MBT4730843.1 ATP-dependent helicase [Candidatus Woesearchaeota archaeon]MBT4783289.1 ATP-dependent helicase [Candidatus Woesearchaeota archaeon]
MKKAHARKELVELLNPYVKEWFFSQFEDFSPPQTYGVKEIHDRNNILISAPTGGTKTLTAFLSVLNELVNLSMSNSLEDRVYAIYVSPLKALNNDIHKNLEEPLKKIAEIAKKHGTELNIRIATRTGDTTPYQRQKMLKNPPHILITTPESLALMLGSPKFRTLMFGVNWMIVDEIHSLADNKRGVHMSLSLERLNRISPDLCRVGLSATVEPIEEVAEFLVGSERECKIAKVNLLKKFELEVLSPVKDFINVDQKDYYNKLYKLLDKLIQEHKTTLIFTNTRAGTERVVHHLKEEFPENYIENIGAHHGSLSKEYRTKIEDNLKEGKLKAVVCSTSLELGIDIGYIDLVICLGSPKGVARFLQRVGRSGHKMHEVVRGKVIARDRDDLVECSVLLKNSLDQKIDRIGIPRNCLDVLAQQIHGMACTERWDKWEMYETIKKSYCYSELNINDFEEVLDYLAGNFASLEDRYVYAKIWYDPETNQIGKKGRMSRIINMTNIGTIPDTTGILVKIKDVVVGTIDEGFLEKLKRGDIFVLGGETYEYRFSRGTVAQVVASYGKRPTVPSWFSEMLPLSYDLAVSIGQFRRYMLSMFENKKSKKEILKYINEYLYVDNNAATALYDYFREQYLYALIPHDKKIVVEYYNSGVSGEKKYYIFHSLFSRRVNDALSRAIGFAISKIHKRDVEIGMNDNGFYFACPKNRSINISDALKLLDVNNFEEVMKRAIDGSEVLKRRFRHCAGRGMMILRNYKNKRKSVGKQQVSSMILMSAVKRISNDFCLLKEARREVLEDLMDQKHAKEILKKIKSGSIEVEFINTTIPSPFAFNLVTQGYTDILRMEDKIEFIKRMHQMVLAKIGKKHKKED